MARDTGIEAKKPRKKIIIAIIVIAAVVVVCLFFYFRLQAMAGQTGVEMPDVVVLTKMDLESKVTASGNFTSGNPVSVGSNVVGGEVEAVYIEVGDKVYAGDMLAKLKTSDIERNIADAKAAISETKRSENLSLEQAQRFLDQAYDDYYTVKSEQDRYVKRANQDLTNAKKTAKDTWDALGPAGQAATGLTEDEYIDSLTILESRAVTTAKSVRSQQLTQAERAIQNAQDRIDSLKIGDSTKQQRSQLEALEESLENASIISPITGIVTSVMTEAGKAVMGNMFIIENTESLEISATIAEYDVIKIEKGMKANIKSNATDDRVYTGEVTYVAPIAADTSGNFAVTVQVTSDIGQLKPGMTATIEIVTAAANDVFAVPIDAIVTKADGKKVVYVYETDGAMVFSSAEEGFPEDGSAFVVEFPVEDEGGPVMNGNVTGQGPKLIAGPRPLGGSAGTGGTRREIVVETGLETDYYIVIISDELSEGMLIESDPMGRGVGGGFNPFRTMGGGMMVSGNADGSRQEVVTFDSRP